MSIEKARVHLLEIAERGATAVSMSAAVDALIKQCAATRAGDAPEKPYGGSENWVTKMERKAYLRGWRDGASAVRKAIKDRGAK